MKRKHWKRLFIGAASVLLLLVLTLFIHIWMVTRPKPNQDTRVRQLARLDLVEEFEIDQIAEMKTMVSRMDGVSTVKYSESGKALIYEFDPRKQSASQVASKLNNKGFSVKVFTPDVKEGGGGCPVMDKSSVSYRLGKFFEDVIN